MNAKLFFHPHLLKFIIPVLIYFTFIQCKNVEEDLSRYLTFLGTDDSPKIITALPGMGDKGIPRDQKITVIFNKPMNINSCIQAFSINPPTQSFFEFNDYSFVYTPSALFSFGSYTYTITKNCEDQDGNDLRDLFSASFTVGEPTIAGTFPSVESILVLTGTNNECNNGTASFTNTLNQDVTDVCMGNPNFNRIRIIFDRDMNRPTTTGSITLSPSLSFNSNWEGNRVLEINPDNALPPNTRITVSVSTLAQDSQGIRMEVPVTSSFRTGSTNLVPEVTTINIPIGTLQDCTNGVGVVNDIIANDVSNGCLGNPSTTPIQINFSRPMNTAITTNSVSITPLISSSSNWSNGNQTLTITPDSLLTFGTRYTITINTQAASDSGIRLENAATYNFVAGGPLSQAPRVQAVGVSSQGCANTFPGVGDAGGGDWTSVNCFWDNSLPILSPGNYRFRSGDIGDGSAGSPLSCIDVNTDNFKVIFSNYMDLNATVNAARLRRVSPPSTVIQLASWNWADC